MIKRISIFAFMIVLLASCVQEVPVNLPEYKSRLVVNGIISDQDFTKVQLSKSISSLDTGLINFVSNATVQIYDQNNAVYDVLSYNSFDGGFVGTKLAKKGVRYSIKANYQGVTAEASTKIEGGSALTNFVYVDSVGIDTSGFKVGEVTFSFTDIPGQDNFYRLNIDYFDDFTKQFSPFDISEDVFIDAEAEITDKGYLFDDESFSGQQKTITARVPLGFVELQGDYRFKVSLEVLNPDLTLYEKSRRLYERSFGGFVTEPVELYSNVEKGLGIFGGVSTSRDTI